MTSLLPLLENLAGPQGFVGVVLALTSYSLVRHVLAKLVEKGPDYIEQLTAYRVAMAQLKQAEVALPPEPSGPVLVFPSRTTVRRETELTEEERRAA